MKMGLVSRAFGAVLLGSVCVAASVPAANAVSFGSAGQGKSSVHKMEEAGIQFTIPAGWEAKSDKDSVKVVPKATHDAQVAFITLPIPTDMKAEEKDDLFNSLVGKSGIDNQTLGEYKGRESLGGMPIAARPFEGKNNGHDVEGVYYLLSADKLVFIVLVGDKTLGDDLGNEAVAIIKSVKKIE
jgi:hypothetical protein